MPGKRWPAWSASICAAWQIPERLLTILAGTSLIATNSSYYLHAPWLHIKLTFVLILIGLHGMVAMRTKAFADRTNHDATQRSAIAGGGDAVPVSVHPHMQPWWVKFI